MYDKLSSQVTYCPKEREILTVQKRERGCRHARKCAYLSKIENSSYYLEVQFEKKNPKNLQYPFPDSNQQAGHV